MSKFQNLRLSIKLNLLLLVVLVILLAVTASLLVYNTGELTKEIATERINEEVNITQKHLAEIEKELVVDVNFTASSIPLVQAVGRRSAETVLDLITSANKSLEVDNIEVFDGDSNKLGDLRQSTTTDPAQSTDPAQTTKSAVLTSALSGKGSLGILTTTLDGKPSLTISAAAPIQNLRQTTTLGAVQMSRQIDTEFLQNLAFQRTGVFLGLIYQNHILTRNTDPVSGADNILYENIAFDPVSVDQTVAGQTVIVNELISSSNVPYTVAYIPLKDTNDKTVATMMVLVELKEISDFQNNTVRNTILVFTVLALIAIIGTYLALQQIVTRPLTALKTIAQGMTSGHYDQRIPVSAQDEVGQLAGTFNGMAEAIQQRETNLQAARAQAERSDQVKSAFLASMSHELRTPLNAVINFTSFVMDGDTGPVNEQQVDLLGEVVGSAKHLLNLINDVLDMSKIEAGSLNLFIEESVNLNTILNSVVTTGRSLLDNKPVELVLDIPGDLPPIRGDKQRILQVFLNLVSNACKFTSEGSIKISAHQDAGEVVITVTDTGPGIAAEDQKLVFEAFKQTTTGLRQGGGTGLGMPIAKSLVEAHKGRLWLESEAGKGAKFCVVLPVKSDELVPVIA